ncbi:spore maturation protein B [Carboxydocella thermautotrophica]|nr:spore maturation protein B [Carboxydocella thermautotrophica]
MVVITALQELSRWLVPFFLVLVILVAAGKRIKAYEIFIEGAEKVFTTAIKVIPYLVAMLVAINVFRASGALDFIGRALAPVLGLFDIPPDLLALAILRPLSGSGALALSGDIMKTYGPDSLIGRIAAVMQGSTETTFYILSLYFGSVGIKKFRHAPWAGLVADAVAFLAAIVICKQAFA